MEPNKAAKSLRRRITFAANAWILMERLTGAALKSRMPVSPAVVDQRSMVVRAMAACFDVVECLRTGRRVPSMGDPQKAAAGATWRVPQHPRHLSYWYDPDRHVLAGLHLGIDILKRGDKFYVIENNLGAALRPERRRLYDTPFDPIVQGLVATARDAGFRNLVPYAHRWEDTYVREFQQAGEEFGVDVRPACSPCMQPDGRHPLAGLPVPLPESTMYAFFNTRHTAVDHFVHSKTISADWLWHGMASRKGPAGLLGPIRSEPRLFVPPADPDERWPNLAIKLDGWDKGEFVAVGRFESEVQAREGLGLRRDTDRPRVFHLGIGKRLSAWLFDKGEPVYQEFIAPDCDADGHPNKIRLHAFLSPLFDRYLSAHAMVAPNAPTETMRPGEVRKDGTFVLSFRKGARYTRLMPELESQLETVADEFGCILNAAITERFETGPVSAKPSQPGTMQPLHIS